MMAQTSATHERDTVLDSFLRRITSVRAEVVELYLYGSRSRGDHRPDSDYDVFVVLRERNRPTVDALYDAVVEDGEDKQASGPLPRQLEGRSGKR